MLKKDPQGRRIIPFGVPVLMFVTVIILASAGTMGPAHGAVPSGGLSHAVPVVSPVPETDAPDAIDLVSAMASIEPGVALQAIRIAGVLGPRAIEAAGPLMLDDDPRIARLARIALDRAVCGAREPVSVANALFRLLARCMEAPGLDEARKKEVAGQVLAWIGIVATEEHVPALEALFGDPMVGGDALAVVGTIPGRDALDALLTALSGKYPETLRIRAAQLLGDRPESGVIRPLLVASAGKPGPMGWPCLEALARHGVAPEQVFALPPTATATESSLYAHAALSAARALAKQGRQPIAERLFLGLLRHDAPPVIHRRALLGLSTLDNPDILHVALGCMNIPGVRASAIEALARVKAPGLEDRLNDAYRRADAPTRAGLLEVLSRRKAPGLAALLTKARLSDNPELRVKAVRLSGGTPSEADLLALAQRSNPWVRRKALADYFNLAETRLRQGEAEAAAAQYRNILTGAFAEEAMRAALYGLARAGRADDRSLMEARLDDPALGDEAWTLLTDALLAETDRNRARAELTRILPQADSPARRSLVSQALKTLGTTAEAVALKHGYPTRWRVLGPLPNRGGRAFGKSYYPASRTQVGPVFLDGRRLDWEDGEAEGLPARLVLKGRWDDCPEGACYALTEVVQTGETPVTIHVLTDGPFECWLNGAALVSRRGPRGEEGGDAGVKAVFRPGKNRILIKTLRSGEPWNCAVQITDRDGRPLPLRQPRE